jgi:hypothetical protein
MFLLNSKIIKITLFMKLFRTNKLIKIYSEKEQIAIRKFYIMLINMKKRRPKILKEIRLINLNYLNHNVIF